MDRQPVHNRSERLRGDEYLQAGALSVTGNSQVVTNVAPERVEYERYRLNFFPQAPTSVSSFGVSKDRSIQPATALPKKDVTFAPHSCINLRSAFANVSIACGFSQYSVYDLTSPSFGSVRMSTEALDFYWNPGSNVTKSGTNDFHGSCA
jgi:hypothetical protein